MKLNHLFCEFKRISNNLDDPELMSDLIDGIADLYEQCSVLHDSYNASNVPDDLNPDESQSIIGSASQVTSCSSTTSSKVRARQIQLECQRIELQASRDLAKAKALAEAAEAEAQFRVNNAKLEAEERILALSECGSTVSSSRGRGIGVPSEAAVSRGAVGKEKEAVPRTSISVGGIRPGDSLTHFRSTESMAEVAGPSNQNVKGNCRRPMADYTTNDYKCVTKPEQDVKLRTGFDLVRGGGTAPNTEQPFRPFSEVLNLCSGVETKPQVKLSAPLPANIF